MIGGAIGSPGMMYFPIKWGAIWNPRILKITNELGSWGSSRGGTNKREDCWSFFLIVGRVLILFASTVDVLLSFENITFQYKKVWLDLRIVDQLIILIDCNTMQYYHTTNWVWSLMSRELEKETTMIKLYTIPWGVDVTPDTNWTVDPKIRTVPTLCRRRWV